MPESWRAKLIARLQEHGGIEEVDIQLGIDFLVMADYFTRNDHIGDLATPGEEHYRKNGQEHTLEDVPWKKVLEHVEKQIGRQVPEDRRTEVFNRVMAGMPSRKRFPDWEKPVVPPNENPSTRFSVSKARKGKVKSNSQLVAKLAAVGEGMESKSVAFMEAQITFKDACGDEKRRPQLLWGLGKPAWVSGGRLGRDHKLQDVPNHFVRDCLMNYIETDLEEKYRKAARKAVFSDLTSSEINEYSSIIRKRIDEKQTEFQRHHEEALEEYKRKEQEETRRKEQMVEDKSAQNMKEAEKIMMLEKVVDAIDEKKVAMGQISQSDGVDCDQLRGMIKIFTQSDGGMAIDRFRSSLSVIERPQFVGFLSKRGPDAGRQSMVYRLSREFFQKNGMLRAPPKAPPAPRNRVHRPRTTSTPGSRVLREADANLAHKRPSISGMETRSKRTKKAVEK